MVVSNFNGSVDYLEFVICDQLNPCRSDKYCTTKKFGYTETRHNLGMDGKRLNDFVLHKQSMWDQLLRYYFPWTTSVKIFKLIKSHVIYLFIIRDTASAFNFALASITSDVILSQCPRGPCRCKRDLMTQ